jgi:hypothetical protein
MWKKLVLLAPAAVLALAVPAMASAHALTSSKGVLAEAKGTAITLTGEDFTIVSSIWGQTTCKGLTLSAELTENNGTTVTAKGTSLSPPSDDCTGDGVTMKVTKFEITRLAAEGSETTMSFVATIDIETPTPIECTYTGTKVPFTYTVGGDSLVFNKAGGISSTGGCGSATLTTTLTIEIGNTPVILD